MKPGTAMVRTAMVLLRVAMVLLRVAMVRVVAVALLQVVAVALLQVVAVALLQVVAQGAVREPAAEVATTLPRHPRSRIWVVATPLRFLAAATTIPAISVAPAIIM